MEFNRILELISRYPFRIIATYRVGDNYVVDFIHNDMPRIEGVPVSYYRSSIAYNPSYGLFGKPVKRLEATIRIYVEGFKQLYLDYACMKTSSGECIVVCRPHVNMEFKILSNQCRFVSESFIEILDRLEELLNDMTG